MKKEWRFCPVWSPDGNWIALGVRAGDVPVEQGSSYPSFPELAELRRRSRKYRLPNCLDRFASWTPDGKWLISIDQEIEGKPYHVVLLSVETGEKLEIDHAEREEFTATLDRHCLPMAARWSLPVIPYGVRATFTCWISTPNTCLRGSQEGSRTGVPNANCPVWMPDGQEIIFCSRVWHYSTIWRIRKDGVGGARALTFGGRGAYMPDVSRKGGRLLYDEARLGHQHTARATPTLRPCCRRAPEKFIQSNLVDYGAAWSPDGRWIAFASERSGGLQMWLCNPDGTNLRLLTAMDSTWGMAPVWSPDSQWIAFTADQGGTGNSMSSTSAVGLPESSPPILLRCEDPQWSGDGKWIYFRSNRRGSDEVWKVPREGGAETPAEGIRMGKAGSRRRLRLLTEKRRERKCRYGGNRLAGGHSEQGAGRWVLGFCRFTKRLVLREAGPPEAPWNKVGGVL